MDRPNAAIKILQMRAGSDDWHRKVLNHILHLEQELTVRDELLKTILNEISDIDKDLQYMITVPTFYKLRDFIKRKEK